MGPTASDLDVERGVGVLATDYPLLEVFWTMLIFFAFIVWIWILFTVLADIFDVQQRVRMQGIFGAVFGLSSVIGPTVGGYITDNLGWRWVFYVNIPVGVLAVAVVVAALPYVRSRATWREIDFLGTATLAAGVIPLLVGLSITNDHSWTSPEVLGLLALAGVMLVAFFLVETRWAQHPVVPFELFRHMQPRLRDRRISGALREHAVPERELA